MDSRSECFALEQELQILIEYVEPLLPLANVHTVDFITGDAWNVYMPESIRLEVEERGTDTVIREFWDSCPNELTNLAQKAKTYELENTKQFVHAQRLRKILNFTQRRKNVKITEFMTDKKLHEVERMSEVVASISEFTNSTLIIDIGSGKGYLPSVLALHHRLRVLGIDSKSTNIDGAIRTTKMLEKKWKVYVKAGRRNASTVESSQTENDVEPEQKSSVLGNLYKQRVEFISEKTNVRQILREEFCDESLHNVLLVGLHTCGSLAADSLKLFVGNPNTLKSFIVVGCCYHLIDEEFASDSPWHVNRKSTQIDDVHSNVSFPMSEYLRDRRFGLGRDARMCATQNPVKVIQNKELIVATKPLFYRALLQQLLVKHCAEDFPSGIIGRMAHKFDSFSKYASQALLKLKVDLPLNVEDLEKFASDYDDHWQRLKVFFLLKTAISPALEAVILLDRLLYLHENGVGNAFITRLFDPVVSPRCYAICSIHDCVNNELLDDNCNSSARDTLTRKSECF